MSSARLVGGALIGCGLIVALGPVVLLLWARQMFTTGLSFRGQVVMGGLSLTGLAGIAVGVRLFRSKQRSA